jgi:hypothetical protein
VARTSDEHAPRVDDQLEREEEALLHGSPDEGRTEPRRAEAPGPDEAHGTSRVDTRDAPGAATDAERAEVRTLLATTFRPSLFPATREELVQSAEEAHADDQLVDALRRLPARRYGDVADVEDQLRAVEIASEVAEENPDPTTRREAIEQALDAEDLSDEGEELGQHND